jgi:hypothetical protein
MFMRFISALIFALIIGPSQHVYAEQKTFAWQGAISNVTVRNGSLPFSLPFSYSIHDLVNGTITFDTSDSGFNSTATHKIYDSHNTANIGGFDFLPTTDSNQLWLFNDDVSLNDGITGYDQFQTFFRNKSFAPGYDVDGGVILRDTSANIFSSTSLPMGLDPSTFQVLTWSLWLHGTGASELTAPSVEWYGAITDISTVPEPGTGFLLLLGIAAISSQFVSHGRRVLVYMCRRQFRI